MIWILSILLGVLVLARSLRSRRLMDDAARARARRHLQRSAQQLALVLALGMLPGCAGWQRLPPEARAVLLCEGMTGVRVAATVLGELLTQLTNTGTAGTPESWRMAARRLLPAYTPAAIDCAVQYGLGAIGGAAGVVLAGSAGGESGPRAAIGFRVGERAETIVEGGIVSVAESQRQALEWLRAHPGTYR